MTDDLILTLARKILPLLHDDRGKLELERLLAQAAVGAPGIAQQILALLNGYPGLNEWVELSEWMHNRSLEIPEPPRWPRSSRQYQPSSSRGLPADLDAPTQGAISRGVPAAMDDDDEGPPEVKPRPEAPYYNVTIHFATDRKRSGDAKPSRFFTGQPAEGETAASKMSYGACNVSIPAGRKHKVGELESPTWKLFENPAKHVVLLKLTLLDAAAFFASASNTARQAFVFVHGFNVTFEDAARRTAQIAHDLPFPGTPILYSWPSLGSQSPLAYTADEASVARTIPHLKTFLEDLAAKTKFETVHIIAHSMGNRAVAGALQLMTPASKVKFHQVVLAAADIDADTFKEMADQVMSMAQRVTLYASADDEALKFSKTVHGGYRRAGDAEGGVLVVLGMDSIDATGMDASFLSHSYFASVRTVLGDLYFVLDGVLAKERKTTVRLAPAGNYYEFIP